VSRSESLTPTVAPVAAWTMAIRPRTLGASVIPVVVGLALSSRSRGLDVSVAVVTVAASLLLQVATNLANDYFDFVSGVDTHERVGPTRVTQAGLISPAGMRAALVFVLAAATVAGAYLVWAGGWPILAIGVAALVAAVAYSAGPWPLSWYGLGDVLAFVFFGVVAVTGTVYLQLGAVGFEALLVSLPVACLVTAIIVVNNLRDIPTDRRSGKRTLAVRLGEQGTRLEYAALVLAAFVLLDPVAVAVSRWALLPMLAAPLALAEVRSVWQRSGTALNMSLAGTARLHMVFGALLSLGVLL